MKDNVFATFRLTKLQMSPSANYSMTISSRNGNSGNAITVYVTSQKISKESLLTFGKTVIAGDLKLQFLYGPR